MWGENPCSLSPGSFEGSCQNCLEVGLALHSLLCMPLSSPASVSRREISIFFLGTSLTHSIVWNKQFLCLFQPWVQQDRNGGNSYFHCHLIVTGP